MKFSISEKASKADLLFIVLEKDEKPNKDLLKVLGNSAKEIEERIKSKDFEPEEGQNLLIFGDSKTFKKIYLIGAGEESKRLPKALEDLGGLIAGFAKKQKTSKIHVYINKDFISELACGIALGSYEFGAYKKADKNSAKLSDATFITKTDKDLKLAIENANLFALASPLARDLINTPAGDLSTKDMADQAKALASRYKMKIKIMDDSALRKAGCFALAGVGQGSKEKSRMIFLEYKNASKSKVPNIAFIGKGVVFDTGGLNLKPTGYIETMKEDMAGAGTVLATMKAIAEAKLKGYYLAVLACAENSVSANAQRPGDVVKAYNGKTIEITNTDAEGRLCLADALAYTEKNYKPKMMLDIATLTGAVTVALGYNITGIMGNDKKLIEEIKEISEKSTERVWELPLGEDFVKATKGSFTDLKNSSDKARAGASMGGAFLKSFVEKTPWVHFDIGGTAWVDSPTNCTKYGATAVSIRTFLAMARKHQG